MIFLRVLIFLSLFGISWYFFRPWQERIIVFAVSVFIVTSVCALNLTLGAGLWGGILGAFGVDVIRNEIQRDRSRKKKEAESIWEDE